MATSPLSQQNIESLTSGINEAQKALARGELGAREKLASLAHALTSAVELPSESIQRIGWAEPARSAVCRIAVDLKIFELLKGYEGSGVSSSELAKICNAHPILLSRMLKHLVAMNIVAEVSEDRYAPTPLSTAFTEPRYRDGLVYNFDVAGPSFKAMPEYFKSINYGHPTDIANGPFQYAHNTRVPFFGFLAQNPTYAAAFNNYMKGYRAGKASWIDPGFYPFKERIVSRHVADKALLVDVGGGMGQDLHQLRSAIPGLSGKLVLQDQQDVISQTAATDNFEATAHDFFTPQPVQGATAYYLHSVLHDWGDDECRQILTHIREAMTKGRSRLLINELVVPSTGAAWSATSMDWLMLALGAVKERTETDWRALVEGAGLRVTGIWTLEQGTESLIEAELA